MFDKFKELILTGLGILAALAAGAAVILYMQLGSANDLIASQKSSITALRAANTANQMTIDNLRSDFATFNQSVRALLDIKDTAQERQSRIEAILKRLEQNDEILKGYFDSVVPASVGKLFSEPTRTNPDGDRRAQDPGVTANPVKASTAAADSGQPRTVKPDY